MVCTETVDDVVEHERAPRLRLRLQPGQQEGQPERVEMALAHDPLWRRDPGVGTVVGELELDLSAACRSVDQPEVAVRVADHEAAVELGGYVAEPVNRLRQCGFCG